MLKSALMIAGTCTLALLSASNVSEATTLNLKDSKTAETSNVIKTHSVGQVHDMLHRYGYYRVSYVDRRDGYSETPIYKFRACKNGIRYFVYVGWYGDIQNTRRIGECYSYNQRRYYNSYGDGDYNPRPSW